MKNAEKNDAGADTVAGAENLPAVNTTGTALEVMDFGDDAGLGMEDVGRDEFIVPILRILQPLSPQCKPVAQGGLPGAKPGMIINTATNELYDGANGFVFVPVHRDHNFVEFIPRNLGGGFVGIHADDDPMILQLRAQQGQFGRLYTSDKKTSDGLPAEGTEIGEQFYLYGLVLDENGFASRVMIAFGSTQIKKYRGFISRVDTIRYIGPDNQQVKPPLWAHRWRLSTTYESNKKGEFYGWSIGLAERNDDGTEQPAIKSLVKRSDPLYTQGREFYDLIHTGGAKVDYAKAADAEAESEEIPM